VIKIPAEEMTLAFILFIVGFILGSFYQKTKWIEKAIDLHRLKQFIKPSEETNIGE